MRQCPEHGRSIRDLTLAFAHAVMHRLRDRCSLGTAADRLPSSVVQSSVNSGNAPLAIASYMSLTIAEARKQQYLTEQEQMLMDMQVGFLIDAAGACDRIHRTPLPFAYVVHLRRAVAIFCLTLPFALLDGFGWWEVMVCILVAFILLGIEEIGVEIEDPFGSDDNDLPLERFCSGVEDDMLAASRVAENVTNG